MSDAATDSGSAEQPQSGAKLTIALLLLWISATALILGACRSYLREPIVREGATAAARRISREQHRAALATFPTIAPIWGIALAGVVAGVSRRIRFKHAFPNQPGHWLLLFFGSGILAFLPLPAIGPWLDFGGLRTLLIWSTFITVMLLPTVFLMLAAFRLSGPLHWRALIWALASSIAISFCGAFWSESAFEYWKRAEAFGTVVSIHGFALLLLSLLGLIFIPIIDLFLPRKFDALHWMGAALMPLHLVWLFLCLLVGSWIG